MLPAGGPQTTLSVAKNWTKVKAQQPRAESHRLFLETYLILLKFSFLELIRSFIFLNLDSIILPMIYSS